MTHASWLIMLGWAVQLLALDHDAFYVFLLYSNSNQLSYYIYVLLQNIFMSIINDCKLKFLYRNQCKYNAYY